MTKADQHNIESSSRTSRVMREALRFPVLSSDVLKVLSGVEKQLEGWAVSDNPLISEISAYLFKNKGKRLRPAMVILTERLLGRSSEDEAFHAALIELIHTASLVHDDMVDDCGFRRGDRTVHEKWGPNITVLLGDFLYIKAMNLALSSGHARMMGILAEVSSGMIEGELDEYAASGRLDTDETAYLGIIYKKTAFLFEACCRIGAVLAQAGKAEEEAAAAFGMNAGMAFQIADDILDLTADPARLGKPVFSDVREGRLTLPLIHALAAGNARMKAFLDDVFGKRRELDEGERRFLVEGLEALGSFRYAREKALEYAAGAMESLSIFPASDAKAALSGVVRFIGEREV